MSEEATVSPLLEWLVTNTDLTSLDELSLATGVDLPSLRKIDSAEATPSSHHVKALRRIFPGLPLDVIKRHGIATPDHISTRRGTLPEGTSLHVGTVGELQVGDYVPYVPPRGHVMTFGSQWVQVLSTERQGSLLVTVDFGGVLRTFACDMSIRFARIAV